MPEYTDKGCQLYRQMGRNDGLAEVANWLRRQANAAGSAKAKAAFIEAHNAVLSMVTEARSRCADDPLPR